MASVSPPAGRTVASARQGSIAIRALGKRFSVFRDDQRLDGSRSGGVREPSRAPVRGRLGGADPGRAGSRQEDEPRVWWRRLGSSCLPSGLGFRRPSFHELEHRAPLLIVTNQADPALVQAKLGNGKNLTVRAPKLHFFEDDPFSRPTKVRTACLRRFASDSFNQNDSFASVALWSWLKYHVVDKPRRADIGGHAQRRGAVQRT